VVRIYVVSVNLWIRTMVKTARQNWLLVKSKSKLLYDWRSVSQYVLVLGTPLGPMARFFFFLLFCRKIALLFVFGRPLWREEGAVICSAICQWSESRRFHNHTLLPHLRLLGYDSQGLWWRYPYPPPHRECYFKILWYMRPLLGNGSINTFSR
jgi:hypothetical protein